jgi:hypothetical protein
LYPSNEDGDSIPATLFEKAQERAMNAASRFDILMRQSYTLMRGENNAGDR